MACRREPQAPSWVVSARFGAESVPAPFDFTVLARAVPVASFEGAELRSRCRVLGPEPAGERALFRLQEKFLAECSLAGFPASFDGLEWELDGAEGGAARLLWRPAAASESVEPVSSGAGQLAEPVRTAQGHDRYRWRRPAEEEASAWAVFGAETRVAATAKLVALRAFRYEADPEAVARALGRRWTIPLADEWREGVPAMPGHPVRWRLVAPADARLRFGFRPGTLPEPRISIRVGEEGAPIFTSVGAERSFQDGAWSEFDIDLAPWSGHEIELVFDVESPGAKWGDWGAWGSPMVLARAPSGPRASSALPDVLLVSVDTLRADHLSAWGYERPTSPELDGWARRRAVLFSRAFAQAPWTLPSHVSMLTGLEPMHHGVQLEAQASRYGGMANLASALASAGYRTEAITGGGFVHPRLGFHTGFDRYRFWPAEEDADEELATGVERALAYFGSGEESRASDAGRREAPRFLFFHTYEVHPPNRAREPWFRSWSSLPDDLEVAGAPGVPSIENGFVGQPALGIHRRREAPVEALTPELRELPTDLYDSAIGYTDRELARLLRALEARDRRHRTLVVVTSDHGESLGEWGRWNHGHLDSANLHVPLLLALPDGEGAGRRIDVQVRSIDLAPTILAALGLPPLVPTDGASLLGLVRGNELAKDRPAWAYGSSNNRGLTLRSARDLVFHFQDSVYPPIAGEVGVFDLSSDPGESRNLKEDRKSQVEAMRALARRLWDTSLPAVRVTFSNPSAKRWNGVLRSPLVEATTVKSFDATNGTWTWGGRGKGLFSVEPGASFSVLLQDRGRTAEGLLGELFIPGCRHGLAFRVELRTTPQSFVIDSDACRMAAPTPGDGDSRKGRLVFRRQGQQSGGAEGAPPGAEDASTLEQLRALGYV